MNIAVVGSRIGFLKNEISKVIYQHFDFYEDRLISGGAIGVDSYAEQVIKNDTRFLKTPQIITPINPTKKLDYLFRNIEIITLADKIIVFWNGTSKGSKFIIDYAKARDKDIIITKLGDIK